MSGWIKVHRDIMKNPVVCKDADHLAIWMELLTSAAHADVDVMFNGKRITLHPGQLITGRKKLSQKWDISESKIERILKSFEIEQQIEQQGTRGGRLISVKNWHKFQENGQTNEQQADNHRTTSGQPVDTIQELKELKNEKKEIREREYAHAHARETDSDTWAPSSLDEVVAFFNARGYESDPERFYNYYEAKGWEGVRNWMALAYGWEQHSKKDAKQTRQQDKDKKRNKWIPEGEREYSSDDIKSLEEMLLGRSVDDILAAGK